MKNVSDGRHRFRFIWKGGKILETNGDSPTDALQRRGYKDPRRSVWRTGSVYWQEMTGEEDWNVTKARATKYFGNHKPPTTA